MINNHKVLMLVPRQGQKRGMGSWEILRNHSLHPCEDNWESNPGNHFQAHKGQGNHQEDSAQFHHFLPQQADRDSDKTHLGRQGGELKRSISGGCDHKAWLEAPQESNPVQHLHQCSGWWGWEHPQQSLRLLVTQNWEEWPKGQRVMLLLRGTLTGRRDGLRGTARA